MLQIEVCGNAKKLLRRDFLQLAAGAATLAVAGRAARAQAYQTQFSKVTVRFATNRNWIGDKKIIFGTDFSTDGLFAAGSIDVSGQGRTWNLDRDSLKLDPAPSCPSTPSISEFIGRSPEKTKLVFLPGFASAFNDAMISSAQICLAYGVDEIFCFSWPSQGQIGIIPYLTDENSAYRSGPAIACALRQVFSNVLQFARVHRHRLRIACHSMGNRALSAAIQHIKIMAPQLLSETYFDYALLMAADEDFDAFQEPGQLQILLKLATQIDVYTNTWDVAMVLSNLINGRAPMGSFGPANFAYLPSNVIWIDCTEVGNTGFTDWGHQYFRYSPQVANDARQVLQGISAKKITPRIPDCSYPGRKFVIPCGPIAGAPGGVAGVSVKRAQHKTS